MDRKTIVFINKFPLSNVYAESIDFDRYTNASYRLVYLDMSKIFFPETHRLYGSTDYRIHEEFFLECKTKEEVLRYIKEFSKRAWFFVLHHSYARDIGDWWLFRAFKKYRCDYILWENFPVPGGASRKVRLSKYLLSRTITILGSFELKKLFHRLYNWIFMFLIGRDLVVRTPAFCFAGGAVNMDRFRTLYPKSEVVSIPSTNYYKNYRFISNLSNTSSDIPKDKFLLYIDQSIFDSPDNKVMVQHTIEEKLFFERINNWFDRLEKVTGKRVVIAASPKYLYKGDEYNGRQIIYNRIIELVYFSDMLILHSSSAVDFAILSHKPIIFLKINGFSELIVKGIETAAGALHKTILDSDEDLDMEKLSEVSEVNKDIYDQYIKDYMITGSFTESPSEIIVKRLGRDDEAWCSERILFTMV